MIMSAMTPQQAFAMYQQNIEDFDQAAPLLMVEAKGKINVVLIAGGPPADGLAQMIEQGKQYEAVLLSAETRMQAFREDGTSPTEGPVDTAVFTYADRTGKTWVAMRSFMRTNGKVTYLGDLEVPSDEDAVMLGAIAEGLQGLVGRT
jgi:hypothetical protein